MPMELFTLLVKQLCSRSQLYLIYRLKYYDHTPLCEWPPELQRIYKKGKHYLQNNFVDIKQIWDRYQVHSFNDLPELLLEVKRLPLFLFCEGDTDLLKQKHKLAIVGTRRMTSYGRQVISRLLLNLSGTDVVIITGGAFGVDQEVIREALKYDLKVITVFGSGLERKTPSTSSDLFIKQLKAGHLLLSEFPPLQMATKYSFPQRNRIISGLAAATVVIEAPQKSGALITAEFALDQNREVFSVPGNIFSPYSIGTNNLIASGQAEALIRPERLVEFFGLQPKLILEEFSGSQKAAASIQDRLVQQSLADLLEAN